MPALESQIRDTLHKTLADLQRYNRGTPQTESEKLVFLTDVSISVGHRAEQGGDCGRKRNYPNISMDHHGKFVVSIISVRVTQTNHTCKNNGPQELMPPSSNFFSCDYGTRKLNNLVDWVRINHLSKGKLKLLPAQHFEGYPLFTALVRSNVFLISKCGLQVHLSASSQGGTP